MDDIEMVKLRPLVESDAPRMLDWMTDDEATRYLHIGGKETSLDDVLGFIESANDSTSSLHLAIAGEDDEYLGTISLKNINYKRLDAEYAIALHPDAWGKGVSSSATRQIVRHAFDSLGLNRIYLNVLEDNVRAKRFYEKYGFREYQATEEVMEDGLHKMHWYEIRKDGVYDLPKDTRIVFFSAIKVPYGGGRTLFLDLASYCASVLGYESWFIAPECGTIEKSYMDGSNGLLHIENMRDVDFSAMDGCVFFCALNHLCHLLTMIPDHKSSRILLYFGHPDIFTWFRNQFWGRQFSPYSILTMINDHSSAIFQDCSNLLAANRLSHVKFLPEYVPTVIHQPLAVEGTPYAPKDDVIRILWMGRLDSDKIYSIINFLDNLKLSAVEKRIEFHIIGDGNARNRIDIRKYAPQVRFVFTSYMFGEERDRYIIEHADFVMAMGICAMDCAMMGIPTVIPVVSATPFNGNQYVYIQDIRDYSVGWSKEDLPLLGSPTHTIKEVINEVYGNVEARNRIGEEGRRFCIKAFDIENAVATLLHGITNTSLTVEDCLKEPGIKKQMSRYNLFVKTGLGGNYDRFITVKGKFFGYRELKGIKRMLYFPQLALKVLKNRKKKEREATQKLSKLTKIQNDYEKKIKIIKDEYQASGKIRVAFLVLFNGVFPYSAVFDKMLSDEVFDPWIIVSPNISRTTEYEREKYFEAYYGLKELYGDRVIDGYDWEKGQVLDLANDYQVVFFSNPYDAYVPYFHRSYYLLKKHALLIYANYGFAALNFWNEIIKKDFYNDMWKVCVETEGQLEYLKERQSIKGRNGFVSGYMKMDSLALYSPTEKSRKRVLICPHHTVWGWKTLNISHFLKYSELFVELPKKYPQIDFVFRPHPLLFDNLISHDIWTQEEIDAYLIRLLESPNIIYDKSGDYMQTFIDSDAMIHDCGSFIGEYLYTEKPCCYMMSSLEETRSTLVPLGNECIDMHYHAFSADEITDFIDSVVLNGDDPLKAKREAFSRSVLKKYYPHSADRIIDLLKQTIIE